jgi:L-ascorbate oxidase
MTTMAQAAAEVFYDFQLSPVLGNIFSPDCQNLQAQRRWLFLAKEADTRAPNPMPGPLIEANEGDTIVVRVTNEHHSLGATIHYHGIHQKGTPYSDGLAQITQCILGPYQSQEYRFEAYPPGSHYWHAHVSMDVADGLSGPLIVHPKEQEPFSYDEDRTLFLQDFYSETGEQQAVGLNNWPFTWVGNPDSILINGRGINPACQDGGGDFGDSDICLDTCQDSLALLSTIDVDANKTYRLRIISSSQLVMQNVAIVGHNMTIVEVEGTIIDPPIEVSNYDLAPGQRVSVLITTDATPENYLIETTVRGRNIPDVKGRAILHYSSVNLALPNESPSHPEWNDYDAALAVQDSLRTKDVSGYEESLALETAEEDIKRWVLVGTQNLLLEEETGDVLQLRWAVNNISNVKPVGEPLIGRAVRTARELGWPANLGDEYIDMPQTPPTIWNYTELVTDPEGPGRALGHQGVAVIKLSEGDVFELVLQNARALNGAAEFHPWHVHGHSFWVVGRGEGTYDADVDVAEYNLEDPLLRDTATLWPLGWTALRFVANNPGTWVFHCHMPSHLVMGMSFTIVVEPGVVGDPSESVAFCNQQGLIPNNDEDVTAQPTTTTLAPSMDGESGASRQIAFGGTAAVVIGFLGLFLV